MTDRTPAAPPPTHHQPEGEVMRKSTVIEAAIDQEQTEQVVTLAELAAEGLGTIDALARQLAGLVVLDDIGRRAVPREVARRLLEERAAAEERRREERRRRAEELARRQPRPPRGVPAVEGMSAYESMLAASGEDEKQKDRAGERMAALMRGESTGARFSPRGE
jgi:hypothetical protein